MQDDLTSEIAAEWITKWQAAFDRGDWQGMQTVVDTVCASPNIPFKREVLRQIEI